MHQERRRLADAAHNTRVLVTPADPNQLSDSGYTNLELWLHAMAAAVEGRRSVPAAPTVALSGSNDSSLRPHRLADLVEHQCNRCTASGAWTGTRVTSGAIVSAPLTSNSIFVLTCTDANGASTSRSVEVSIAAAAAAAASTASLTLVNADTDRDIGPLVDGATFRLATIGTNNLTVRAHSGAQVASVRFGLDGNAHHSVENILPFVLAGERDRDLHGARLAPRAHSVSAILSHASAPPARWGPPYASTSPS